MISFTPKERQDSPKLKLKRPIAPSELTIRLIMSYAAAMRVINTKSLGSANILLN